VLYEKSSYRIVEHSFGKDDLLDMTSWWQERLRGAVHDLPCDVIDRALSELASSEKLNGASSSD
jgi:putative proteasome-type protease